MTFEDEVQAELDTRRMALAYDQEQARLANQQFMSDEYRQVAAMCAQGMIPRLAIKVEGRHNPSPDNGYVAVINESTGPGWVKMAIAFDEDGRLWLSDAAQPIIDGAINATRAVSCAEDDKLLCAGLQADAARVGASARQERHTGWVLQVPPKGHA